MVGSPSRKADPLDRPRIQGESLRSPAAHILETALALQRAPGERFRLRDRALPPGVIHLIEVAAGSPSALQAASAELGEEEPVLQDAARFYLEQVLFADPGADAYRVLGLAADAPHDAIRTHHRWLQRWLHPDRAQAGDASVFATRVNQAFAQLRTPETRHAYDVRLAEARLAGAAAPLPADTLRHWEHADAPPAPHGRRSRWLLAAGLAACVVLAVLIVRQQQSAAPWEPGEHATDANAAFVTAGEPAPAGGEPGGANGYDRLDEALASPPTAQPEASVRVAPTAVAIPAAAAATGPTTPAAPTRHVPAPERLPAAGPAPAPVRSTALAAAPAARPTAPVPATRAPSVAAAPAAAVAPALAATSFAPAHPTAPPAAPPQSAAKPGPAEPVPAPATAATATPATAAATAADAALVVERLPLAQQRVQQLAGYLGAKPGAVPLWDTVQAMQQTDQVRQRLGARKGSGLVLEQPGWHIRPEQASLEAAYRCRADGGAPCAGRLQVSLVWREGLWLVRSVAVEPSA